MLKDTFVPGPLTVPPGKDNECPYKNGCIARYLNVPPAPFNDIYLCTGPCQNCEKTILRALPKDYVENIS